MQSADEIMQRIQTLEEEQRALQTEQAHQRDALSNQPEVHGLLLELEATWSIILNGTGLQPVVPDAVVEPDALVAEAVEKVRQQVKIVP